MKVLLFRSPLALPALAAAVVIVATGIVHGVRSDRWGNSTVLNLAVQRMQHLPAAVGDWQGQVIEPDADEVDLSGSAGCVIRRYTNRQTGDSVLVVLLCGRPGPVSIHTPDVCYSAVGFRPIAAPATWQPEDAGGKGSDQFMRGRFHKDGLTKSEELDILWSWSATGTWSAPNDPRVTFAPQPFLYKIYLIRQTLGQGESAHQDPVQSFVSTFKLELNRALFPGS
jgi:hypothetical protein